MKPVEVKDLGCANVDENDGNDDNGDYYENDKHGIYSHQHGQRPPILLGFNTCPTSDAELILALDGQSP